MTAINNPANAVTPNVIPAAVPAFMLWLELWEDFCLSCVARATSPVATPIMAGPSRFACFLYASTVLSKKKRAFMRWKVSCKHLGMYNSSTRFFNLGPVYRARVLVTCWSRKYFCNVWQLFSPEQVVKGRDNYIIEVVNRWKSWTASRRIIWK